MDLASAVRHVVTRSRPRRRVGVVTSTATPAGTVEVDFVGGLFDPVLLPYSGTKPATGDLVEAVFGSGPVVVRAF